MSSTIRIKITPCDELIASSRKERPGSHFGPVLNVLKKVESAKHFPNIYHTWCSGVKPSLPATFGLMPVFNSRVTTTPCS